MGNRSSNDEARKALTPPISSNPPSSAPQTAHTTRRSQHPRRHSLQPFAQRRNALIVSALATISLPSASSFSIFDRKNKDAEKKEDKPYEVSLVLVVVVKKLVRNMIVKTPSNRLSYNFTTLSQKKTSIEPVASVLQIRSGMVPLRHPIQTQGNPASAVLPYTNDILFFDTPVHSSVIFTDAFACPTTMTTTVTTTVTIPEKSTVIKDEASVKVDESLHLPGCFGGTLNDTEIDGVGLGA
ncbi:hypothetical protein M422DRAFT_253694 [Sphaerobolus stellatus SS14]|uniref:Uncharacterized protein n=1 Tax=Sphaerobolus stellatus (strain SS14) TaxID=990650 RepID=A0A0C9UJC4_SPHS4|nr:hypothetical protein M422DRAFT_253694 [Sphaerobolus stellatus SS14]